MGSCVSSSLPPVASSPAKARGHGRPAAGGTSSSPSYASRIRFASKSRKGRKKVKEEGDEKAGGSGGGGSRRRRVAGGASAGGDRELEEHELPGVPGRAFSNGTSDVACLYTQQGRKGTNQDAMIVWENFITRSDTIFCGVFDGHGPFGHMVSKKVRDSLPLKLSSYWRANTVCQESPQHIGSRSMSMNSEEAASVDDCCGDSFDLDENAMVPEMYLSIRQTFRKAFKSMDKELKFNPIIDCFCSGTTAVTLIKQGQDLVIGNLGDSRAVMGTRDNTNNLVAVQLTTDLKPNLPGEAARIQQCRGRVFAMHDEPEVSRVWLPNNNSPGLAMARAFGDFCLKDYGLISIPDVSYRRLSEKDEFIVLASDGVWDVLSNKEVIDVVASAPTRGTAARALVDSAVRTWRLKFPTSKIDDCTVVCLFLEKPPTAYQSHRHDSQRIQVEPQDKIVLCTTKKESKGRQETQVTPSSTAQSSNIGHCRPNDCADDIVPTVDREKVENAPERSQSTKTLGDCLSNTEEEEWSALEGITRVNSLVNLPRIISKSSRWKKWLKETRTTAI